MWHLVFPHSPSWRGRRRRHRGVDPHPAVGAHPAGAINRILPHAPPSTCHPGGPVAASVTAPHFRDREVRLAGWARTERAHGRVLFTPEAWRDREVAGADTAWLTRDAHSRAALAAHGEDVRRREPGDW
jgi:hypothetical protein